MYHMVNLQCFLPGLTLGFWIRWSRIWSRKISPKNDWGYTSQFSHFFFESFYTSSTFSKLFFIVSRKLGELSWGDKLDWWSMAEDPNSSENRKFGLFLAKTITQNSFLFLQFRIRDQRARPLISGIIKLSICSNLEVSNNKMLVKIDG